MSAAPAPPLHSRGFRWLLLYRICTLLSYQIVAVTVGWHIYELTGDPLALMLVAATSSGLSPLLWGELPGPGQIGMALAILYVLGAGYGSWRHGVPDYATIPGALSER